MQLPPFNKIGEQIIKIILYLRQAPEFIQDNKLWRGYFSIGWISKLSVFVAIVFSYTFITGIFDLFSQPETSGVVQQSSLSFINRLGNLGDSLLLSGSMKYLILILLETVIFHFVAKTQEILSGEKIELTVNDFIAAQIRMIKIAIRSWFFELIISGAMIFILKLFGLDILSKVLFFFVQAYFLGLAFIDNYNEQKNISIKESFSITYDHIGAAIVVGVVAYTLFLIPLFGIIITPFICAVGTTTYMYYSDNDQDYESEINIDLA